MVRIFPVKSYIATDPERVVNATTNKTIPTDVFNFVPKSRLEKSLSCVCKNNNNSNSCNYCYSGGYNNSCSNISTNSSIKRDDNRSTNSTERVQESTELCDFCSQNRVPVVVVSSGQALHQRYDINNDNVDSFVANGVLEPLLEESFLIYAQVDELLGKKQVGIFAAIDVQDCQESVIKRHEQTTRKGDVSSENSHSYDRKYMDPVMIMYRESAKINEVIDRIMSEQEPMEMMVTNNSSGHSSRSSSVDSIISNDSNITSSESSNDLNYCNMNKHYLWSITSAEDVALIRLAFESIPSMYIADGHHRTAAACKTFAMNEISENDPNRYLTSLIYPANQLNVLSFNRCVQLPRELFDKEEFFAKISENFQVVEETYEINSFGISSTSCSSHVGINMYLDNLWYHLSLKDSTAYGETPLHSVDAQMLLELVLQPIFHVGEVACKSNMIYVDGREGRKGLEDRVINGEALVAFSVRGVSVNQIMDIADNNQLLPPKATFFDPKPAQGLLLRIRK